MKLAVSWSGGKDACLALYKVMQQLRFAEVRLLHMAEPANAAVRAHALPKEVVLAQAAAMGLRVSIYDADWDAYAVVFQTALQALVAEGFTHIVYGDINLLAHKQWQEEQCKKAGITPLFPLWEMEIPILVNTMIKLGMKMRIISCQLAMGAQWLGRELDVVAVKQLQTLGIDECGEGGEFHTLVYDGPMFAKRLQYSVGAAYERNHYWFLPVSAVPGT